MKKLLIIMITMGVAIGCEETHCPAFPVELMGYYPYSTGDLLWFMNHNGDILEFKVANSSFTDSYSYAWNCKCACGADGGFETEMENTYSLKIQSTINIYENGEATLHCTFNNAWQNSDFFEIPPQYSSSLNEIFDEVIIMEKEEYNRIGKVKIVKGKGIVEFWDKEQNCNWVKVE